MRKSSIYLLGWALAGLWASPQSGITGMASIWIEDAGTACGDAVRVVRVMADVTGMTGTAGESVGINSFAIDLTLDRADLSINATAGSDPIGQWRFFKTDASRTSGFQRVIVVGATANPDAPNEPYELARLLLSGDGDLTLSFNAAGCSLGSRVVTATTDGPGPIPFSAGSNLTVSLPLGPGIDINEAASFWLQFNAQYDVTGPPGVDILDLAQVVSCLN